MEVSLHYIYLAPSPFQRGPQGAPKSQARSSPLMVQSLVRWMGPFTLTTLEHNQKYNQPQPPLDKYSFEQTKQLDQKTTK